MEEYLILINIITFLTFAIDKLAAIKNHYRIPEKILFLLSLIGGAVGGIISMILFRHKTKKLKFFIIIIFSVLIHIILFIILV